MLHSLELFQEEEKCGENIKTLEVASMKSSVNNMELFAERTNNLAIAYQKKIQVLEEHLRLMCELNLLGAPNSL
jgi:hypothetical protein